MRSTAGLFFFLSGTVMILGILISEIFYSSYSITNNMVSDLGVNNSSEKIFNFSLLISGIMILIGACYFYKAVGKIVLPVMLLLLGIGIIGVGIFPEFHLRLHPIVALLAFGAGGVSAILSVRFTKPPFSILALILGIITLTFLFLGVIAPQEIVPILGRGGTERLVLYPAVIWMLGFGGYLMNSNKSV